MCLICTFQHCILSNLRHVSRYSSLTKPLLSFMAPSNEMHMLHWISHQLSGDYALTIQNCQQREAGQRPMASEPVDQADGGLAHVHSSINHPHMLCGVSRTTSMSVVNARQTTKPKHMLCMLVMPSDLAFELCSICRIIEWWTTATTLLVASFSADSSSADRYLKPGVSADVPPRIWQQTQA